MITDYFSLKGKRALITGAGKGIGARIATAFAEMGADVALVARTQSDLDTVADEVRVLGREAHTFACDVTDEAALTGVVQTLTEAWGSLDILINNAGAPGQGYGSLKKVTKARFENTIDIKHQQLHCSQLVSQPPPSQSSHASPACTRSCRRSNPISWRS